MTARDLGFYCKKCGGPVQAGYTSGIGTVITCVVAGCQHEEARGKKRASVSRINWAPSRSERKAPQ